MSAASTQSLSLALQGGGNVSALLDAPPGAHACYVMAHGAGAGMTHSFIAAVAKGLADRGIATLRYQFPFVESGSKRPDPPAVAHAAVRSAVAEAQQRLPALPCFAGGKSFGGRMTSQAQAKAPLPGVLGLVFFGFPLHPAGKPGDERAAHLAAVDVPMLFLQGTRDALADAGLIQVMVNTLGARATLEWAADADHAFHVPARSGRKDAEVLDVLLDRSAAWIAAVAGR
jgi:predicted alpha/beta-hydrolase family hydrolase